MSNGQYKSDRIINFEIPTDVMVGKNQYCRLYCFHIMILRSVLTALVGLLRVQFPKEGS